MSPFQVLDSDTVPAAMEVGMRKMQHMAQALRSPATAIRLLQLQQTPLMLRMEW